MQQCSNAAIQQCSNVAKLKSLRERFSPLKGLFGERMGTARLGALGLTRCVDEGTKVDDGG